MKQKSKYWIIIIQALDSSAKLKTGRGIFIDVNEWCNTPTINIVPQYREVTSKIELQNVLDKIVDMIDEGDSVILHIESHGNYDGIWLVNDGVGWEEFFQTTHSLCEKAKKRIVFILSMCRSKHSASVLRQYERIPFQYLIVSDDIVNSGPACLAFKRFYKSFVRSKDIQKSFADLQDYYAYYNEECPYLLLTPQVLRRCFKDNHMCWFQNTNK